MIYKLREGLGEKGESRRGWQEGEVEEEEWENTGGKLKIHLCYQN